ncbi:MAG: DUF362 domain-containing protein [Pseudomonadota bacterium]
MDKKVVSIVRYEKPLDSVRRAVELCDGLDRLPGRARVFIKPNIVFWCRAPFPKWGVITTSRVIEDLVILLKERGVDDIVIGEGMVLRNYKDTASPADAFEKLGYNKLRDRYGVKSYNTHVRPFAGTDLGGGVTLNFNQDILESDFVVNLPVLKTHAQTTTSLGIKNLKGMIDVESRKKCHSPDLEKDLDYMVARLADKIPPSLTLIDGIYSLERGPSFDGRPRRTNLLVGSADVLSADLVGTRLLGHDPSRVRYLALAARERDRPLDLSDIDLRGENLEEATSYHEPFFPYNEAGTLPLAMEKSGLKGLYYQKYDNSLCTYCSGVNWVILASIFQAWKGRPWDEIEVLTGKRMKPTPGRKKTILLGKCMCDLNQDDPNIQELITVKGCPPPPQLIVKALRKAGLEVDAGLFENLDEAPGFFMKKYASKPEFEESFFQVE